jgi:8-oxo-dGTP pyrophosphatase MutT (NUDIX family)
MDTDTNTSTDPAIPEFGIKRQNEERRDGGCAVVFDPATQKYAVGKQDKDGFLRLFSGGVGHAEDMQTGVLREVTEESGLHDFLHVEKIAEAFAHYHNSLRKVNRVAKATCFLVILRSISCMPVHLEEHEKFSLAWATADEILADWHARNTAKDYDHWIYFFKKSIARVEDLGYAKNSQA